MKSSVVVSVLVAVTLATKSQVGWDLLGHGFASVRPSGGKDSAKASKLIKLH